MLHLKNQSFQTLIDENRQQILGNKEEIEQIYKRVDQKAMLNDKRDANSPARN
ncbi:FbpB family small basic protein [Heyndrickxia ginsengihumi]|uniref:FbpB family small basic protein n=1 Tax=Heyndrickxia ginsengihumi TaxID=363870 RepID=UPI0004BB22D3|nr:FbpB family small basic protein [Heyndrickxia ginsengihumi]